MIERSVVFTLEGQADPPDRQPGGYHYYVYDEQLAVFASLTPARRLQWLEEMRELTVKLAPPEAQQWWRRFREGR